MIRSAVNGTLKSLDFLYRCSYAKVIATTQLLIPRTRDAYKTPISREKTGSESVNFVLLMCLYVYGRCILSRDFLVLAKSSAADEYWNRID